MAGIDNDKIAVQEAKPALINDLGALHYLSPDVASTILWSAERLRRGDTDVVSAHVDSSAQRHFAERERIRRCEAEEVRGRRAQLHELRQKLDAHHTGPSEAELTLSLALALALTLTLTLRPWPSLNPNSNPNPEHNQGGRP